MKLSNFILHQFGGLHKLWDTPILHQFGGLHKLWDTPVQF